MKGKYSNRRKTLDIFSWKFCEYNTYIHNVEKWANIIWNTKPHDFQSILGHFSILSIKRLNLICVGPFGICFEVGVGKITPCLKLVRVILETWNLVCKYTHMCSFRKYTIRKQGPPNFTNDSKFFQKIYIFWQK